MGKKSAFSVAIDSIDKQIEDLQRTRSILVGAAASVEKQGIANRVRKPRKPRGLPAPDDFAGKD